MASYRHVLAGIVSCGVILFSGVAAAQTGANVAVVINELSPASVRIGEYYAQQRSVPAANVIRIRTTTEEEISRRAYAVTVETPVAAALTKGALQDRVFYLLLTKGIPLRIAGTDGLGGDAASVDSELTLLYRKMTGRPVAPAGPVPNPYYLGVKPIREATRFTHREHDIFLVTRLDGVTLEDALALVDRAQQETIGGAIVMDQRAESDSRVAVADRWMSEAAEAIRAIAPDWPVLLEGSRESARSQEPVLGYFSWGRADPAFRTATPELRFAPGSIAATLAGADARTFGAATVPWGKPAAAASSAKAPPSDPEPLVAKLVSLGATGAAGYISEPYLQSALRPQILFPAYLTGLNLAESYYLALPHLSWQSVVVGDPLCRAKEREAVPASVLAAGPDDTGLPPFFLARRLESARREFPGIGEAALKHVLAANVQLVREDRSAAKAQLTKALELAGVEPAIQLHLATLHDEDGEWKQAQMLYRRVLDSRPRDIIAMNNLAYSLATNSHELDEAEALARRALTFAPNAGAVIDTLGWVEHLRGNHTEAARLMRSAAERTPDNPSIRLHAAIVLAAAGAKPEAARHLAAALELDPSLATRDEVKRLQRELGG